MVNYFCTMLARGPVPFATWLLVVLLTTWVMPRGVFHDCHHGDAELTAHDDAAGSSVEEDCPICDRVHPPCKAAVRPAFPIASALTFDLGAPSLPEYARPVVRSVDARGPPVRS